MIGRNVCAVCMDPVAETHRYVTGYRVLYLCDGCAERMRMERCREDEDRVWHYPTHDMGGRPHEGGAGMTGELFVCVPIGAVQDCGDHAVVSLGTGEEAMRLVMSAMSSPGKVAVLGAMQAFSMEASE